jgi:hypothetical protein
LCRSWLGARTTTMFEVVIAFLSLSSAGIFAAHAIDAWRA